MTVPDRMDRAFHDRLMGILADVPDPEIPGVSVVDLGIVQGVGTCDGDVHVNLTPTYSGCPATAAIQLSVRQALDAAGLHDVGIRLVLSPAWSTDMITDAGRERLKAYGIAPPPRGAGSASLRSPQPVECPRCGSSETEEVSRFGSTPCKALWRCRNCLEPFDNFKCH
ncbi:ring-1,2-phenylacetyl-CoA epoxidase subunit PaaD [Novosphingobium sp. 1529]|uniref:1,2-phenylacetyl-CoA epoxidase subunit PaaD n=1 Tax=Novosphingobium sp. 1529 TaxID=3156424 RepID=UPI00145B94B3